MINKALVVVITIIALHLPTLAQEDIVFEEEFVNLEEPSPTPTDIPLMQPQTAPPR